MRPLKHIAMPVLLLWGIVSSASQQAEQHSGHPGPVHWSWGQIKEVGGIRFSAPRVHQVKDFGCTIPLQFRTPKLKNPDRENGAWVDMVRKRVVGNVIQVWIVSQYLTKQRLGKFVPQRHVMATHIQPGIFRLRYLDPDGKAIDLRSIELKRD